MDKLTSEASQDDLLETHYYIESLDIPEETKEVCRGIMLGRYWAIVFARRGMEITNYSARELIDMVIDPNPSREISA